MSTNKTSNLNLHNWESSDRFLRSELNENFSLLDASVTRLVVGSYTGDNKATRDISLGFTPKAVYFCDGAGKTGYISGHTYIAGGLLLPDCPLSGSPSGKAAELTDDGFRVYHGSYNPVNATDEVYRFVALR